MCFLIPHSLTYPRFLAALKVTRDHWTPPWSLCGISHYLSNHLLDCFLTRFSYLCGPPTALTAFAVITIPLPPLALPTCVSPEVPFLIPSVCSLYVLSPVSSAVTVSAVAGLQLIHKPAPPLRLQPHLFGCPWAPPSNVLPELPKWKTPSFLLPWFRLLRPVSVPQTRLVCCSCHFLSCLWNTLPFTLQHISRVASHTVFSASSNLGCRWPACFLLQNPSIGGFL